MHMYFVSYFYVKDTVFGFGYILTPLNEKINVTNIDESLKNCAKFIKQDINAAFVVIINYLLVEEV